MKITNAFYGMDGRKYALLRQEVMELSKENYEATSNSIPLAVNDQERRGGARKYDGGDEKHAPEWRD